MNPRPLSVARAWAQNALASLSQSCSPEADPQFMPANGLDGLANRSMASPFMPVGSTRRTGLLLTYA